MSAYLDLLYDPKLPGSWRQDFATDDNAAGATTKRQMTEALRLHFSNP